MSHSIAICCSIEGEQILLSTRQFMPSPPHRLPGTKITRYGFQLGMNSRAEILQEFTDPNIDPVYSTSNTKKGDVITGQCIDGWSTSALIPSKKKLSGAHSGVVVTAKRGAYAHIQTPARVHLQDESMNRKISEVTQSLNSENKYYNENKSLITD